MHRLSRGFTLIEVLITIAIITVLAGMAFVGFKVLGTGGKTNTTKTAIEACKSMQTELEVTGGLKQVQALYPLGFPPIASAATANPIPAPRKVTIEAYESGVQDRFGVAAGTPDYGFAVRATQAALKYMLAAPRNQTIFGQLPTERLLKKPDGTPPTNGIFFDTSATNPTNPTDQPKPPLIVDAWNNPIIFVPPAGLSGVKAGDQVNRVRTSAGIRGAYTVGQAIPAGATAFFASAGPDGDFSTDDDNVYSFEN